MGMPLLSDMKPRTEKMTKPERNDVRQLMVLVASASLNIELRQTVDDALRQRVTKHRNGVKQLMVLVASASLNIEMTSNI